MSTRDEPKSSRDVTDTKLRAERDRTDEEILDRSTALGETADEVIERARVAARVVLDRARSREDRELEAAHAAQSVRTDIAAERKIADDALATQYAEADAAVLDERAERRRAIIQLLAMEREETDVTLTQERGIADRMLTLRDDVLNGVTHDLRNHLSAVRVRSSAILATHAHEPALVEHMQAMQRSMVQMDGLLKDLLDVARSQTDPARADGAASDLAAVVSDAVTVHQPIAEAQSSELVLELRNAPLLVQLGAARMSRVMMNVLANALKFTPPGGSIHVAVWREANEACVSVKDSGPGIPADQLDAIFERFTRVDTHTRGYGLGLYIAREVMNAHGGRIWAESKLGEGATFHIRLPVASDRGQA